MNIDDIEYLINLVYEFYYVKNTTKCINTLDITLDDCKDISNIKITPSVDKVTKYINNIFNTDINYIGKYQQNYVFTRIGQLNTTITLRLYQDNDSIDDFVELKRAFSIMVFPLGED